MMQHNPMEDKHLNFNQPLLSVRRGSSTTALAEVGRRKPPPSIPPLPYYKSELKSGPVSNPGVVPFQWERIPGRPKNHRKLRTKALDQPPPAPKLPPGRVVNTDENSPDQLSKDAHGSKSQRVHDCPSVSDSYSLYKNAGEFVRLEEDREENGSSHSEGESTTYLDALDTLSRSESFFLNCSLSGVSGSDGPGAKSFGAFSDPQTRDFMMGRFLPAAKAVASETPHFGTRKQPATKEQSREVKKVIILDKKTPQYHYTPRTLAQHCEDEKDEEDVDESENYSDDDDDDYAGTENVPTKLCGLLPRFCLLNTIPGMRDQAPLPPLPAVHKAQKKLSDPGIYKYKKSEKAIRDAVYERRRLTVYQRSDMRIHAAHLKDEQKKHNKQNGSFKLDEVSQFSNLESTNAAPFISVSRHSLTDKEKGFLGNPEAAIPSRDSKLASQRMDCTSWRESLADETVEKDFPVTSAAIEKTLYIDSAQIIEYRESKNMSDSRGRENSIDYSIQDVKDVCFADEKTLSQRKDVRFADQKHSETDDKESILETNPLLPPPLPKSPSESWLSRALPSMSSKHHHSKMYLGTKILDLKLTPAEPNRESSLHNDNFSLPALMPISED